MIYKELPVSLLAFAAIVACAPAQADTLAIGNRGEHTVGLVDLATGRECARVATGQAPHEVAASLNGRQAGAVAYGDKTIDVFDVATRKPLRTLLVSGDARAMQVTLAFSADGRRLFVAETMRDTIAEIDPASGTVQRRIAAGKNGDGLGISARRCRPARPPGAAKRSL